MKNKVEILTHGARRLVFINGVEIGKVMRIETPKVNGQTGPRVLLEFEAESVLERVPTDQEWSERCVLSPKELVDQAVEVIRTQMQRGML